jgi:hypothetical protein
VRPRGPGNEDDLVSVCPLRCRNSGGTDGGSARKILNCVHMICKLYSGSDLMQNIRTFPKETR